MTAIGTNPATAAPAPLIGAAVTQGYSLSEVMKKKTHWADGEAIRGCSLCRLVHVLEEMSEVMGKPR